MKTGSRKHGIFYFSFENCNGFLYTYREWVKKNKDELKEKASKRRGRYCKCMG